MALKEYLQERLEYLSTSILIARGKEFGLSIATKEDIPELKDLYSGSFGRGELFGITTEEEFEEFKKNLEGRIESETDSWVISRSLSGDIATSTLFAELKGEEVVVDDFTQTNPNYRGLGLTQKVFGKTLPLIKKLNYSVEGESVLTESSKSLRYVWIKENGAICIGIKPNITSSQNGRLSYLITPIYPTNILPGKAVIIPQLEEIFKIVAEQIKLENPKIADLHISNNGRPKANEYSEVVVNGSDPIKQGIEYEKGFRPVWYDPLRNKFGMAKFSNGYNLDFLAKEQIGPANRLLKHLKSLN